MHEEHQTDQGCPYPRTARVATAYAQRLGYDLPGGMGEVTQTRLLRPRFRSLDVIEK